MSYKVDVSFRKPVDFSNMFKDTIIGALPGRYKVGREELNSMSDGSYRSFEFENEQPAANFAKKLLSQAGGVLDIRPGFQFNADKNKK